jgi:hypothetical protein
MPQALQSRSLQIPSSPFVCLIKAKGTSHPSSLRPLWPIPFPMDSHSELKRCWDFAERKTRLGVRDRRIPGRWKGETLPHPHSQFSGGAQGPRGTYLGLLACEGRGVPARPVPRRCSAWTRLARTRQRRPVGPEAVENRKAREGEDALPGLQAAAPRERAASRGEPDSPCQTS